MGAQFAKVWREADGRLGVKTWYQDPTRPESVEMYVKPGGDYLGVPYSKWVSHLGEVIDLTTWEGTGEGMIGGPTKALVDIYLDGPLAFVNYFSEESVLRGIRKAEEWLRDDRYEFTETARKELVEGIAYARKRMQEARETKAELDLKHHDDPERH